MGIPVSFVTPEPFPVSKFNLEMKPSSAPPLAGEPAPVDVPANPQSVQMSCMAVQQVPDGELVTSLINPQVSEVGLVKLV